jgi:transposase
MTGEVTIGVDISKDRLDVFLFPDNRSMQFTNAADGFEALIKWLDSRSGARIIYEATGPYHRAFERALAGEGLPLCKVNPKQARRFAEATGRLAKTDRVDAAMLARMGVALQTDLIEPVNQAIDEMRELLLARRALVKDRTAAKNRGHRLRSKLLKAQNATRLQQIETHLRAIDNALKSLAESNDPLKPQLDILVSIPGIAANTALCLLIDMPELGKMNNKQASALAGLAPMTRQSGKWSGKAWIMGGRSNLRQALYIPALVACRFNPDLKAKYDALRKAGKPAKVAIAAVMRKLLILANACLRRQGKWHQITP